MDPKPQFRAALDRLYERSLLGTAAWQRASTVTEGLPRMGTLKAAMKGVEALLLWDAAPVSWLVAWEPGDVHPDAAVEMWLLNPMHKGRWVALPQPRPRSAASLLPRGEVEDVLSLVGDLLATLFPPFADPLRSLTRVFLHANLAWGCDSTPLQAGSPDVLLACAEIAQLAADFATLRVEVNGGWENPYQEDVRRHWPLPVADHAKLQGHLQATLEALGAQFAREGILRAPRDWARDLGMRSARALQDGEAPALPEQALPTFQRLRRQHIKAVWPHLWDRLRYAELIQDPHWDGARLARLFVRASRGTPHQGRPLGELPCALIPIDLALSALGRRRALYDEEHWRAALSKALGADTPAETWSEWTALLAPLRQYRRHPIPRRSGGLRWLDVPGETLARAQAVCARLLVAATPSNTSISGFLPRRGPSVHALAHQGARALVSVDIADFFGSVRPSHLARWMKRPSPTPFGGGLAAWSEEGKAALLELLFWGREGQRPFLPQGSPASPAAANLAALAMDSKIRREAMGLWGRGGFVYTRYADDLVLSSRLDIDPQAFVDRAQALLVEALEQSGWRPNPEKTHVWSGGTAPMPYLCGIQAPAVSGGAASVGREALRRGRAARRQGPPAYGDAHNATEAVRRGTASWLYAATGAPGWLAYTSADVREIALSGSLRLVWLDYIGGWDQSLEEA